MTAMTIIHIFAGTVAVLSGAAALIAAKGSPMHQRIGQIFFVSMAVMAVAGVYLALVMPMAISVLVGVFTLYLVTTSWSAARRRQSRVDWLDYGALGVALAVAMGGLVTGLEAMNSPDGLKDGLPAFPHFVFGGLALLAAAGDVAMLIRRGITGKQRIARHLWRMCFAYFIAAGSLFTGPGATVFPESVRESGILSIPEPLILAVMLFWLVRVLATKWFQTKPAKTAAKPATPS